MGKLAKYLYADEAECVNALLNEIDWNDSRSSDVTNKAQKLVEDLRKQKRKIGSETARSTS